MKKTFWDTPWSWLNGTDKGHPGVYTGGLTSTLNKWGVPSFNAGYNSSKGVFYNVGNNAGVYPGMEASLQRQYAGVTAQTQAMIAAERQQRGADMAWQSWVQAANIASVGKGEPSGDIENTLNLIAVGANTLGVVSDISREAGYVTTVGTNFKSFVRTYSTGWNGNQYTKTLSIAKVVGYSSMAIGTGIDIYLSSTINPQTGNPYQTWEETGLNGAVSIFSIFAGVWGIPIQMNYILAKPYFKALQEHPDWVTYKYHPR